MTRTLLGKMGNFSGKADVRPDITVFVTFFHSLGAKKCLRERSGTPKMAKKVGTNRHEGLLMVVC